MTTFAPNSTASPPAAGWRARDDPGSMVTIPAAAANGWRPGDYEVSEDSGILRQGEYRVDGEQVLGSQ